MLASIFFVDNIAIWLTVHAATLALYFVPRTTSLGAMVRSMLPWFLLAVMMHVVFKAGLVLWAQSFPWITSEVGQNIGALIWLRGGPLYPDPSSLPASSLLYGPWAFAIPALALSIVESAVAPKVLGLTVGVLAVLLCGRLASRVTEGLPRWHRVGVMVLPFVLFDAFLPVLFSPKGDGLILLATAIPWMYYKSPRWFILSSGALGGLAVGIKATSAVAFLPHIAWAAFLGAGAAVWVPAIAAGLAVALAPFLLPGISLQGYLRILKIAGHHHIHFWHLAPSIGVLVPWLIALWAARDGVNSKALRWMAAATGIVMAILLVVACKAGSGQYQLLALAPSQIMLLGMALKAPPRPIRLGITIPSLLVLGYFTAAGCYSTIVFGTNNAKQYRLSEIALSAIAPKLTPPFAFAPGATEALGHTDYGPSDLVFYLMTKPGGTALISPMAVLDYHEGGLPVPSSWAQSLKDCAIAQYVTYSDEFPFFQASLYEIQRKGEGPIDASQQIYAGMNEAFLNNYRPSDAIGPYRVWTCHTLWPSTSTAP